MNFTSQICTTKEQSERLLTLGLKKETADCRHWAYTKDSRGNSIPKRNQKWVTRIGIEESVQVCGLMNATFIPAWSLHKLMCLCPTEINGCDFYVSHDYVHYHDMLTWQDDDELVGFYKDNPFDSLIDCIEWLIKEGYFNKEYLKE